MARKTTFGTRTKLTTPVADLGSIVRFNSIDNNSISFSFILDKRLQLIETPITNYPIINNPNFNYFQQCSNEV